VAIDPRHLPDDPKVLQQMLLDLMAQLDREFTERNKIETLLRELLDAKRRRKSEQLSDDQLALFAALSGRPGKRREKQQRRPTTTTRTPRRVRVMRLRSRSGAAADSPFRGI
jgi:hypothetical protein